MCSSHLRSFRVGVLWQGPARGSWSPAAAPAAAAPRRCRRSRWPRPAAPRWRARRKKGGTKTTETRGNDDEIVTFMCIYIYIHVYCTSSYMWISIRSSFLFWRSKGLVVGKWGKSLPQHGSVYHFLEGELYFFSGRKSWLIGFRNKPLEWDGHKPNQVVEKTTQPVSASSIYSGNPSFLQRPMATRRCGSCFIPSMDHSWPIPQPIPPVGPGHGNGQRRRRGDVPRHLFFPGDVVGKSQRLIVTGVRSPI